jgi:D-alanyl-lipoteichoic acid acyltransferase DltB (MBOAT superfamily)
VHAVLLLAVTAAVYVAAAAIAAKQSESSKSRIATMSVAALVALLAGFKCAFWRPHLLNALPWRSSFSGAALFIAPLGLSYYVFRLIGYLLDVYWGKLPAERNFARLALYVSFFPQIVSGPIQRAGDFMQQLDGIGRFAPAGIIAGLERILFGLFKKVVIADHLAAVISQVHAQPEAYSSLELLLAAYGFAFQLYTDFSGLTDIALGIGQLFGIKGPENFDHPFTSRNVQEFWRRWHMSLTFWLSDYLFLPLQMSLRRFGTLGLALAVGANMMAIGLWHGLTWTYAAFGAVNAVFMIGSVLSWKRRNQFFRRHPTLARLRVWLAPVLTFHLVVISFILFRANSIESAATYFAGLAFGAHAHGISVLRLDWTLATTVIPRNVRLICLASAVVGLFQWINPRLSWVTCLHALPRPARWAFYYLALLILFVNAEPARDFIYAQF